MVPTLITVKMINKIIDCVEYHPEWVKTHTHKIHKVIGPWCPIFTSQIHAQTNHGEVINPESHITYSYA